MGNGKVLEGLSGPRRKNTEDQRQQTGESRDAQDRSGTKDEELHHMLGPSRK